MGSIQDDLFSDYMQHLSSFGSGGKAYAAPLTTTVPLSSQQGGVLGACKTDSSGTMSNPIYKNSCTTYLCSSSGS